MSKFSASHHNAFDFMRFLAALVVIFAHSYALDGKLQWPVTEQIGNRLTFFAVATFFVISGYLITHSWLKQPEAKAYLIKRFLRLWPGLVMSAVFTTFIIGPLVTTLPIASYFSQPATWLYPFNASTLYHLQYSLPGVFEKNPYAGMVNGSLWTLPLEFACYLAVLGLGMVGLVRKQWLIILGIVGVMAASIFLPFLPLSAGVTQFALALFRFAAYFGVGMLFAYQSRERLSNHWLFGLSILSLGGIWITPWYHLLGLLSFSYLIFYLSFRLPMWLNTVRKYGDLSYGMYIYAYPVQQAIVYFTKTRMHPLQVLLLTLVLVIPISLLSWKFVEEPALNLKPKTPRFL